MALAQTFLGGSDLAVTYADTSYQLSDRINDNTGKLRALNTKAHALYNLDKYTEAMACLLEAMDIAESNREDSTQIGITYRRMANINYRSGDSELMHENLLKSYEMLKNTNDEILLIGTLGSLAHSYRANDDLDLAKPLYQQVLEIAKRNGLRPHLSTTYNALRQMALDKGDLEEALRMSNEAVNSLRGMNDKMILCENLISTAEVLADLGRYEEAQSSKANMSRVWSIINCLRDMMIVSQNEEILSAIRIWKSKKK